MDTIGIKFNWAIYRPDMRQYRQQSIELEPAPEREIMVLVPIQPEYIFNFEKAEDGEETAILTIEGLKYIINQFDAIFKDEKAKVEENWGETKKDKETTENDDGWDEETESETNWEEDWK